MKKKKGILHKTLAMLLSGVMFCNMLSIPMETTYAEEMVSVHEHEEDTEAAAGVMPAAEVILDEQEDVLLDSETVPDEAESPPDGLADLEIVPVETETDPTESATVPTESIKEDTETLTEAETTEPETVGELEAEKTQTEPVSESETIPEETEWLSVETMDMTEEAQTILSVEEVKAMIDALPSVSELENMSEEERDIVYEQAQKIYDAFEALTDEEQLALAENLQKLADVLEFYTTQAEPLASVSYITDIGIAWAGSTSKADGAKKLLNKNGFTVCDYDLNENVGGKYVYMGYKTSESYDRAITGILLRVTGSEDDHPDYYDDKNGVRFYLVGGKNESNGTGDGVVDLKKGVSGNYIYLYVTRDRNYGSPLTELQVVTGTSYQNVNTYVTNTDGAIYDINPNGKYSWDSRYICYKTYRNTDSARRFLNLYYIANNNSICKLDGSTRVDWPDTIWYASASNMSSTPRYDSVNYQFMGWSKNNSENDFNIDRSSVYLSPTDGSSLSLYAVYQATTTLTYDANGGTGQPAAQSITVKLKCIAASQAAQNGTFIFDIPNTTPTNSSKCKFLGWSTDKNATRVSYSAGNRYYMPNSYTLYAVYQADHTYSNQWTTTTTQHWHDSTCGCGHGGTKDKGNHSWSGGVCTDCQYVCKHNGATNGYCTICGECLSNGSILTAPKQENGIYLIYTPAELAWFSAYVNGKNASIKGKLMADINMSSTAWSTIGTESKPYTGTFDGNGKKVTLKLSGSTEYLSMFSYVKGATIQNLTVDGTIDASYHYAASIIGRVTGGTVTLKNCLSTVAINSSYDGDGTHGGMVSIVASGTLNIENCGFAGKMIGTKTYSCGGMVGWTDKSAKTNISNSYVAAEFNLKDNSGNTFGRNPNYVSLTNCYYLNALSDPSIATKMSADSFQSGEVTWLLNSKSASGVWKQTIGSDSCPNFSGDTVYFGYRDCGDNGSYSNSALSTDKTAHVGFDSKGFCTLCGGYQPAVWNQSKNYYEISNAGQLFWFAEFVNKGNNKVSAVLTADIDLEDRAWTPIGLYTDDPNATSKNTPFYGTFDGQYHVISNLKVDMSENNYETGLFSRVATGGTLKNFGVVKATVTQNSNGHENKGVRTGVIAGEIFNGTVTNVFTAGSLSIATKHEQKGGIAGECASSTLTSCYTTYDILTTKVSVDSYVPTITRCYYKADSAADSSYGENMTEVQFKSGEVTYKLNNGVTDGTQIWYQTIGTDDYPKFSGGIVYYHESSKEYSNEKDIASVSIEWKDMKFSYSKGTWDTDTMTWKGGGWKADEDCGTVTVTNTGTMDVTAIFGVSYTENVNTYDISVSFFDGSTVLPDGKLKIAKGEEKTVAVELTGKEPSDYVAETTIGQITVTLSTE